ncbi:hypothetical protein M9H77_28710 [Catharanthus roseus]|uniref:Uncharacterized protein n=1 Tax=Catharanthus roseus TaxID=4058 RepID=A0ACC0AHJ4_CATRO|nr:hypothetical protein M9H77_28710 [Catharanthus roseus]
MKKFFFFRSSSSNSGNNQVSPPSSDKQIYWEKPSESNDKSRIKKRVTDNTPSLRRSLSSSSAAIFDGGIGRRNMIDQSGSPCSTSNGSFRQLGRHSSRTRTLTPERQNRLKSFEPAPFEAARKVEKLAVPSSGLQYDSSECSSFCSSNVSNGVLDRYIDGEQQEKSPQKSKFSARSQNDNGNGIRKPPPVFQYSHPASPTNGRKQKPKSQSFRETNGKQLHFSSRDWVENGFGNESPRKLAKHVIERLSQTRVLAKKSSRELDPDIPITVEDIYSRTLSSSSSGSSDGIPVNNCALDELDGASGRYHFEQTSEFPGSSCYVSNGSTFMDNNTQHEGGMDLELFEKFKEAERRALLFSDEQENFLRETGVSLPALMQTVRGLNEERVDIAYEVSSILKDWIADRASLREELKVAKAELDSRTQRLAKEKNELQSAMEKELDRRSGEWSLKLEKYQAEEHRLRERVRELAEQNVFLQREVFTLGETEADIKSRAAHSEKQLEGMTKRMEEVREENKNLQQNLSELAEKYRASEEDRECMRRNYEDKVKECKDLHRSVTRLQRTCSEQEKTIEGLRGLCEEIQKNSSMENSNSQLGKLRIEQLRLTGLEHSLRKELDSYRLEVDSLRHENINLLHRLKDTGKEGGFSTFKLDQELWNRMCCLQNQGLSFLSESAQLCGKLLDYIKTNASHNAKAVLGAGVKGLTSQFIVECEVKLQGFNRGMENLTKSLSVVSTVLHEKSHSGIMDSQCPVEPCKPRGLKSEDTLQSELTAETLLTSLLKEKLYSKELDLEQLRAELAAAIRGNDILKSEVQNASDTISCLTHKMKDLELQMIKKDENVNQIKNELQDCTRELTIVKGILPKVSEERDMMWDEVKQYSEKNMLLNCELNTLKKKIEALDEDILLKEGQITILKDAIGNKPFDLLASPDSVDHFLVK